MSGGREKKLLPTGEFERFLEEEMSVAFEFDLPLAVMVVRLGGGWDETSARLALDVLRLADLAALSSDEELVLLLPNTGFEGSKAVERRVREVYARGPLRVRVPFP